MSDYKIGDDIEHCFGTTIYRNGIELDVCDDCKKAFNEFCDNRKREFESKKSFEIL